MTEVYQFPDRDQVEREAADWIARLNACHVTDEDRTRFAAWCAAHPSHARTYEAMCEAWRAFKAAGPLVRAVSFGQSMNEAAKPVGSRRPRLIWEAAAASIVAVAISLYLWHAVPEPALQTGIGEHASISLPDGTTVELNSDSRVRVDYSEHRRLIHLDRGEAFFKVIHDPSRPFFVSGGGSWVRDVGTEFSVYVQAGDVRVTVDQGSVEVGAAYLSAMDGLGLDRMLRWRPTSVLTADEQADIRAGTATIRRLPQGEISRLLAWRNGKISFEKQPLGEVIKEMSRYTTLQIIVRDPKLQHLVIGGTFPTNPQGVETLIAMLHDGFGLRIERGPGRAYIEATPHSGM